MIRRLYTLLFYSALPLVVGRLYVRGHRLPAYRERWLERLGFYGTDMPVASSPVIWLHAVSVGEVEAAVPLVRAIMQRWPSYRIMLTTTTPTGSARVQAILGHQVSHVYLPYDLPVSLERFLQQFHPVLAIIMETEIWPNLLMACQQQRIPVMIANARLSARSSSRYAWLRTSLAQWLSAVHVAAQTEDDAARFQQLGCAPQQVTVTGNLKFDLELPEELQAEGARLGRLYAGDRPILLLASSHAGEEVMLLEAFSQLRQDFPDLVLAVAPRHPERFNDIYMLCVSRGWKVIRRSAGEQAAIDAGFCDVLLLDTLGELRTFYAASTVACIGGSLVPVGGHNVLEAAAQGVACLYGPHTQNFREICDQLADQGGAVRVQDQQALVAAIAALLHDPAWRHRIGLVARQFVLDNRGALQRHLDLMSRWLPVSNSES